MQKLTDIVKNTQSFLDIKKSFESGTLHHALLVLSSDNSLATTFCEAAMKMIATNAADRMYFDAFLVKECNQLIELANLSAVDGAKAFVINASPLSTVVQNKLLKTIEEPPKNTYFFIVGQNQSQFLPTIVSRCNRIVLPKLSKNDFDSLGLLKYDSVGGSVFLASKLKDDKAFAKSFELATSCLNDMQKSSDIILYTRKISKDKETLSQVLDGMEILLKQNLKDKANAVIVDSVFEAKKMCAANVNVKAVADNLLIEILEKRYLCKNS